MPVHVPEHLEDLARRIRAAGAPTDFLESNIVEHVSRELARKHAVEHAAALVDALNETPGAPRAKLWTKADRADVRVYFAGDLGYVSVGWDGSIGGAAAVPGRRSQSLTFSPDSLYPSQRRAYRQALDAYREGLIERLEEHAQERVEKIAELRVALGVDAGFDEDVDEEAIERAAERAAWQAAHEAGRRNPSEFFVVNEANRTSMKAKATRGPRWKWEGPLFAAGVFDSEDDALEALATVPKAEQRKWRVVDREEMQDLFDND